MTATKEETPRNIQPPPVVPRTLPVKTELTRITLKSFETRMIFVFFKFILLIMNLVCICSYS